MTRTAAGGPREHQPPTVVEINHATVVSLRPEAKRRDVPVVRLIRNVLDALGDEPSLVGAILDDGELPSS